MVGEGWKCKVCLGGVVYVSVDDQHRADGGGEALEVGVAVIRDKLKAGEVAVEEGASDEDGQALSSQGVGVIAVWWSQRWGGEERNPSRGEGPLGG